MACGSEQSAVLPGLAALGAAAWAIGAYRLSLGTKEQRQREWRKRRAGEALGADAIEPKALGRATVTQLKDPAEVANQNAMRAIHEDRVLLIDRDGYLTARSYLRIWSCCCIGISVAAAAQPGGGDLIFSSLRLLLLTSLCVDFALTAPGHVALRLPLLSAQREVCLQKLPLLKSKEEGTDSLLSSLTSSTLPFERLRLCALQLWALLMLIWFEVFRHPQMRESACRGEDLELLLFERSSALTMTLAWLCNALTRLAAWRCEACVWLAPRAEELLAEFIDSDRGLVLNGSLALAEALCGERAEQWLRELQDCAVMVMDGPCQLGVAKGVATLSDVMDLQRDVQAEMRRWAPVEAPAAPAPAAQAEQRRPQASRSREELLKTKLDFPRGIHAEGRPSDSGDSSSSPRHVDVQRVATDLKGGGLAQMLEQALTPEPHKAKAARELLEERVGKLGMRTASLTAGQANRDSSERSVSQGSSSGRRPKRYSEMRKLSLEQRANAMEAQQGHWTGTAVAPAPPSPPWNVQSLASPLTTLMPEASRM